MATITASAAGGNWNATGTWTGAVVPLLGDDVILASTSGSVAVNTATCACRSLDCQATGNYAGTLSTTAGSTLTIGTSTVNGTLCMRFSTTMTWSPSSATTAGLAFASSSATQIQITTAGRPMGSQSFTTVGGSYLLMDTWVAPIAATSVMTLTAGTLNTNNQTLTFGLFNLGNAGTRALTLGTSSITLTGTGAVWAMPNTGSMTFSGASSTITCTGAAATFQDGATGGNGNAYGSVIFTGSGNVQWSCTAAGSGTSVVNFTRTGTAVTTDSLQINNAGSLTVSGALTFTGNSVNLNRLLVQTSTIGTSRTIALGTTGTSTTSANVDFQDITITGTNAPLTGASLGDCLGNSGITFTAAVTRFAVVAGNWSLVATWSSTSGGAGGSTVPLPQDSVIFNASSAAGTYTCNALRACANLTMTGFTRTLAWSTNTFYGNIVLASGMTSSGTPTITLAGRGAQTWTSAGLAITANPTFSPFGGSYTLQDDFISVFRTITVTTGTFDAGGHNVTIASVTANAATAKTINLGTGTWTLSTTGTVAALGAPVTVNASTSTIVISDVTTATKTFGGAGQTFNNLTIPAGGGAVSITAANTWNTVTVTAPKTMLWGNGVTQTIANYVGNGSPTAGMAQGAIAGNYASSPDSVPLSITGSITIDVNVLANFWTPGSNGSLVGKWLAAGFSYLFYLDTTGKIFFVSSSNGTSTTDSWSTTSALGFTNGTSSWLRASVTMGVGPTCTFYKSTDGVTWTLLPTTAVLTTGTAIFDSTTILEIGSNSTGTLQLFNGIIYEAIIYNSALGTSAGTPIFDANFDAKQFGVNAFHEYANGALVTINGALAQQSDGRISLASTTPGSQWTWTDSSGTNSYDYLVIQDGVAAGVAKWYAGAHSINAGNDKGWIFSNFGPTVKSQAVQVASVR